jgi:hypothetical protein
MDSGVEIEHIMPQTCPNKASYGVTEEEYALLINRLEIWPCWKTASTSPYITMITQAKASPTASKFISQKSIPGLIDQGTDTAITRTNKKLASWSEWNKLLSKLVRGCL